MLATRVPILGIALAVGLLIVENVGALAYQQARHDAVSVRDVAGQQRQRDIERLQREIEAKRLHVEQLRRRVADHERTRCGLSD